MANNFMVNVPENFDVLDMANEVAQRYQSQGFKVNVLKMKNGAKITFDKNCGGINTILGMGLGISATCMLTGKEHDTLNVTFSDGDWTGKIVGCVVGLFLCFIPVITAVIGICKQSSLPNQISNDIQMIVSEQ